MLKPLSTSKKPFPGFVTCDIENWPDGSVLSINTCWRPCVSPSVLNLNFQHAHHNNWSEWFDWLSCAAERDDKFQRVYAHNGGGWDWLSFIAWLFERNRDTYKGSSICSVGSKVINMFLELEGKTTIALCDSLPLLRSSLDDLGKKFVGRGKVDLGGKLPHEIYLENPQLFQRYENDDTELLLEVLENSLKIVQTDIAPIDSFASTIGSTAMKVFRTIGFDHPIMCPSEEKLKSLLREGYTGGRVECFKSGVFGGVTVYDINSLYPYAMKATEVPTTDRGIWVEDIKFATFLPTDVGCYTVEFSQTNLNIPAVLCLNGEGTYQGTGTFFTPELRLLLEVDPSAVVHIKKGFVFLDTEYLFKPYVDKLYGLRMKNMGTPLAEICKYLLNSLYGKWGQHSEREKTVSVTDFDTLFEMVGGGAEIRPMNAAAGMWLENFGDIDEDGNGDKEVLPQSSFVPIFGIMQDTHCQHEHVGIAGMITSYARTILYRSMQAVNRGDLLYCDTDSIHTTGKLPLASIGKELGKFKVEFEGSGAYAGKKLYALKDKEGKEKVRAKGVAIGGKFGGKMSFDDMVDIVGGGERFIQFSQPATINEVLKGVKPCILGPLNRGRTIRRTAK